MVREMEAVSKTSGSPSAVQSAGTARKVSEYEQKLLSMSFIGIGEGGRYVFRFTDDPLSTFTGDFSDFCDWRDVHGGKA